MALQTNLALRQFTAALLLLATLTVHASHKPHAKAHKAVSHKTVAHKASTRGPAYGKTTEAIALADELAQQYKLPQTWVREQISKAQHLKSVPKMVLPPSVPTTKNWRAYRERFIESRRIEAGTQFWQTHESALTRAEQTYGVPAEMIVGIIGVETIYGRNTGNYQTVSALSTLAFDYPRRAELFRGELEDRVERPACLERASTLQVFCLQTKSRVGDRTQRGGLQNGRAMDVGSDAFRGGSNVVQRDIYRGGALILSARGSSRRVSCQRASSWPSPASPVPTASPR